MSAAATGGGAPSVALVACCSSPRLGGRVGSVRDPLNDVIAQLVGELVVNVHRAAMVAGRRAKESQQPQSARTTAPVTGRDHLSSGPARPN
jgi:hypothetical protein